TGGVPDFVGLHLRGMRRREENCAAILGSLNAVGLMNPGIAGGHGAGGGRVTGGDERWGGDRYDFGILCGRGSMIRALPVALAEPIAKADPGNAGWQRDLSVSPNKIGAFRAALIYPALFVRLPHSLYGK